MCVLCEAGLGSEQECWTDRGAMTGLEGSGNVHVLVNLDGALCVSALMNFCLYQLERRKGSQLPVFVCESCV